MTSLPELPARVRAATPDDVPEISRMIRELANFERAGHQAQASDAQLHDALFGPDPSATALIAEATPGSPVGFALWYRTFSTWEGEPGMHLEDLFVEEPHRGTGLGRDLLTALARIATERGKARLEWDVLRWNTPSIHFYDALKGEAQEDWLRYRLSGDSLVRLALE